jgi:cell division protein FtsI (penicillin-binding protein 3)
MSTHAPRRTVDLIDRRVGLLFGLFLLLLALALGRAAYLGTIKSGALKAQAVGEHVDVVTIPAVRGEVTDRDGVVLALSESFDSVIANPHLIKHPESVAAVLAPFLGETVQQTVAGLTASNTGYVVLNSQVPAAKADELMSKVTYLGIDGITDVASEHRVYPRDTEAAQVLGWVGASGGVWGLEQQFNHALSGTSGTRRVVNDAFGKAIQVDTTKPMAPGKTLQLTLSAPLQSEVEQVLAGVGAQYQPESATAIVTDPQTDQILALANWPSVNANDVTAADLNPKDPVPPAEDQAVDFSYEPGSTFKAITVAGALQDGLVTPSTVFDVPPHLASPYLDGRTISDAEPHGYENLTVAGILKVSSNIGADLIGQRLGATRFAGWVSRFGFGHPTGVALPNEQRGITLPVSQYSGASMFNLPFGQGEEVTPMQMVQAYDAIANGGVLRTPQIVDSIGGKSVPEPKGKRIISPQVASELRDMLRGVFADGGTASGAAIPGYDLAGKTGTANVVVDGKYSGSKYIASFIGMVPASDPKLVVAVVVNEPQHDIYGGSVAAPAFQKIVGWAVPYFRLNPCLAPCPASALNPAVPSSL